MYNFVTFGFTNFKETETLIIFYYIIIYFYITSLWVAQGWKNSSLPPYLFPKLIKGPNLAL